METAQTLEAKKDQYRKQIQVMSDKDLRAAANMMIYLSAYADNNPRSDYHWKCDAVYDECKTRGKLNIYEEEHKKLVDNC